MVREFKNKTGDQMNKIKTQIMKKVITDNSGLPLGWMKTTQRIGSIVEVVDSADYAYTGIVAEPLSESDRCFEGVGNSGYPENNELK